MCIMFSNKATFVPRQNYLFEIIFQDIALIDIYTSVLIVFVLLVSLHYSQAFCPAAWDGYSAI